MDILLDTQILIWALSARVRIPQAMREAIGSGANVVFASAASVWEIAIKSALGKLDLGDVDPVELPRFIDATGFGELPVLFRHAVAVHALPPHHRDPFDRMLIAQARTEGLTLATVDPAMRQYDVALF